MPNERTPLPAVDEIAFQTWAKQQGITDVNDPRAKYDYRGYWKANGAQPMRFGVDHFPDTYKQHGHPTFSVESQYSAGPHDGGRWNGEAFIPPGADLMVNSRGKSTLDPRLLREALLAQLAK